MAPEHVLEAPATPKRGDPDRSNASLKTKVDRLCACWPLALQLSDNYSPAKNKGTLEEECLFLMGWCHHKKVLDTALEKFHRRAEVLYSGWVNKPEAERGVIPQATKQMPRPVSDDERKELLDCLIHVFRKQKEAYPDYRQTPRSSTPTTNYFDTKSIPFPLAPRIGMEKKRAREEESLDTPAKKPQGRAESMFSDMQPLRGRNARQEPESSRSANTSFASTVFSHPSFDAPMRTSTQETAPDDDELPLLKTQENVPASIAIQKEWNKSSDYGPSSSYERAFNDSFGDDSGMHDQTDGEDDEQLRIDQQLSQTIGERNLEEQSLTDPNECKFRARLENIFPNLPPCLRSLSIYVIYEITRVFLHAGVSLEEFDAPVSDDLTNYNTLWKKLKSLPCLEDRPFPEPCGAEVWAFAVDGLRRGGYSIVFAGSFCFGTDAESVFRLRLDPLKLDHDHRLGRQLGTDRFFEISIPSLDDRQIPKSLAKLGHRGRAIFLDWFVDSKHHFLGRTWQPFASKPKERRASKQDTKKEGEANPSTRFYLYALGGHDYLNTKDDSQTRIMSISALLNVVRPTIQNESEPYLKLFSRTSLALSRNRKTVVLLPHQIRFEKQDILCNEETMNDGAARISFTLAMKVRSILGLSYLPSAFQARLGEAKGLWVVDNTQDLKDDWIQVYHSQQKWRRDNREDLSGVSDDESHRTFEVLRWSGPLKSADLNTQLLPLLMEQAKHRDCMKSSISKILQEGLASEVTTLKEAFENPQSLRKWVREVNPNIKDRLKHGAVSYRAGMPTSIEEQLNMLLDAGFNPMSNCFVYECAKSIFQSHCDVLVKRLNITVGKSTYAYMVPDFWNVLEPDEVYIDFSGFVDSVSGFSGALINGADVLVARSPAHFISDIQKVKAVVKVELMGLKDVIVFPTRGKISLASKLSGGDYDGDIAWVCWEESIVDNFVTAEVPIMPDLVDEGFLRKDKTTYKELVESHPYRDPTSVFLKKSFDFNMRQSMLGICTDYKEKVCYTQGSVSTEQALYLSKLLSDLVDAPKQGFSFGQEDFDRFKEQRVGIKTRMPKYKSGELYGDTDHILDHLSAVSQETIKVSLGHLWAGFEKPPYWDNDLVSLMEKAKINATKCQEWHDLLQQMINGLKNLKEKWSSNFNVGPKQKEERKANFSIFLVECFHQFNNIVPSVDTPLTQSLQLTPGTSKELSQWSLLKASTFFSLYSRNYVSNAVWWIAGRQLARIKADCLGLPHLIVPSMFIIQKPDHAIIRRLVSDGHAGMLEESGSVRNVEELEELEED